MGNDLSKRWDLLAIVSGGISAAIAVIYLLLIKAQGSTPAWWFLCGLIVTTLLLGYSARRQSLRGDRRW